MRMSMAVVMIVALSMVVIVTMIVVVTMIVAAIVIVGMLGFCLGQFFHRSMMVEVKGTQQKEHHQQANHHPPDAPIERHLLAYGMGQQVEQADAQHQPTDEADRQLHAGMGHPNERGQIATAQRAEDNQQAVERDEDGGRHKLAQLGKRLIVFKSGQLTRPRDCWPPVFPGKYSFDGALCSPDTDAIGLFLRFSLSVSSDVVRNLNASTCQHNSTRWGLYLITLAAGIAASQVAAAAEPENESAKPVKWIQLFNGKDLHGWTPKIKGCPLGENLGETFRVVEGLLCVSYDKYDAFEGRFGHLFYEKPYANYRLRLEYRFVGEQAPGGPGWAFRNSGVMIHGESPETMSKDQEFPVSIEVQLLGGRAEGERHTANLCTPGTHVVFDGELLTRHCTDSKSETYRGDQWVTVEVEVRGNKLISHTIDGEAVLSYTDPQYDTSDAHSKDLAGKQGNVHIHGGTISLQSESHPIQFRRVELLPLDE